jgi:putative GTP pyrophosphokinase
MNGEIAEYRRRYDAHLQAIAARLETHIKDCIRDVSNVDRVSARAKNPDRFAVKAQSKYEMGRPRYSHPLSEVQDQIGARITVFYLNDVTRISQVMERYFRPIEQRELVPESEWEFGYFGRHFILALPRDVVPEPVPLEQVPTFFELQIKTLFQHAWSEANHDLGYKAPRPLSSDENRRLAYTAAQAWGADRLFEELRVGILS